MRSVIAAVALALLAVATGANAQTQPQSQGTQPSTSAKSQAAPGATDANPGFFGRLSNYLGGSGNVRSPREPEKQDPDLAYQACYMRCINTGNPADFCEAKAGGFCPK